MYFGKEVERAIIKYNSLPNSPEKEKIYNTIIYPALSKLVENNIYKHINQKSGIYQYGILSFSDLKHEFIVFLNDQLYRYSEDKGRAFSYFNRININHIYGFLNELTLSRKTQGLDFETGEYDRCDLSIVDKQRDIVSEMNEIHLLNDISVFCEYWSRWGILHLDFLFISERDKQIAEAVFNLFLNCQSLDIYNKKALYIMIREQVETKTQYITETIKVLKKLYKDMYKEYQKNGSKYWHRYILIDNEENNL